MQPLPHAPNPFYLYMRHTSFFESHIATSPESLTGRLPDSLPPTPLPPPFPPGAFGSPSAFVTMLGEGGGGGSPGGLRSPAARLFRDVRRPPDVRRRPSSSLGPIGSSSSHTF